MSWLVDVNNVEENWILDVVNNQVVISLTVEQQSAIYATRAEEAALQAEEQANLAIEAKDDAIEAKIIAETKATESATSATNAQLAADSINAVLIQNLGSISGNVSINLNLGTLVKATLTGSVTLSFTGLPSATSEKGFTLRFSGLQMIVFPVGTLFASGDAPTPAGTLYDIPCSISSAGVVIVYGSINTIEI